MSPSPKYEISVAEKERANDPVARSFERIGIDERVMGDEIIDRLERTEGRSHFNEDARMIEMGMEKIFPELNRAFPELRFSADDGRCAFWAALVHDIGKIGNASADRRVQEAVIDLYAAENLNDPRQPIREAAADNFGEDKGGKIAGEIEKIGLSGEKTMRDLWDIHDRWGYDILEKLGHGIPERVKIIAASHHMGRNGGRGFNPYGLPQAPVDLESFPGDAEAKKNVVLSRLLIALDKYEAARRRNAFGHEAAFAKVQSILEKENFGGDPVMRKLCLILDRLGRDPEFFGRTEETFVAAA